MKTRLFQAALVILTLLAVFPASAKMIGDYSFSGGWTGEAYGDDRTGQFTHCVASVDYKSGLTLLVSVDANYVWNLGLVKPDWGLKLGSAKISYRFDDNVWRNTTTEINDPEVVIVTMPDDATIVDLFRRSRQMLMRINGRQYGFNLDGTARVTVELVQCVGAYLGTSSAAPSTTVAAAPPAPASPEEPTGGSGTGIIVSATGYVLTNNHVVKGCRSLSVTASGAASRPADLIRTDETNDLALLKVDGLYSVTDVAVFRAGNPLKAGEIVAVYGYPFAGMLSQSGNVVSGNITALSGLGDDVRFVQISAPVQPGNSGGPLMDASGLIVGVVNARMNDVAVLGATGSLPQNVNFAIRGNVAMNFLDAHSIPYKTASSGEDLTLVDIAERAKKFAALVRCQG